MTACHANDQRHKVWCMLTGDEAPELYFVENTQSSAGSCPWTALTVCLRLCRDPRNCESGLPHFASLGPECTHHSLHTVRRRASLTAETETFPWRNHPPLDYNWWLCIARPCENLLVTCQMAGFDLGTPRLLIKPPFNAPSFVSGRHGHRSVMLFWGRPPT